MSTIVLDQPSEYISLRDPSWWVHHLHQLANVNGWCNQAVKCLEVFS